MPARYGAEYVSNDPPHEVRDCRDPQARLVLDPVDDTHARLVVEQGGHALAVLVLDEAGLVALLDLAAQGLGTLVGYARRCQDLACRRLLGPGRVDKCYCSKAENPACARRQATRRQRESRMLKAAG